MISRRIYEFCNDDITKIENYEQAMNDTTQTWHCHHRLETDLNLSIQELKDRGLYFNRPASELIFLTHSEHTSLHNIKNKGKFHWNLSEETRKKMSEAKKSKSLSEEHKKKIKKPHKYRTPWNKGLKGLKFSEETKRRMKEAKLGKHKVYDENGKFHYV